MKATKKRAFTILMTFCMIFSLMTPGFAASAADKGMTEEPIIIGEYDGPLSECLDSDSAGLMVVSNVRVNSYATYDKNDGVQVYVKLYVPWYELPKPQFTSMGGTVSVYLNSKTTNTSFYKIANGDSTIDTSVDTDVTGSKGDQGTVTVSGVATSNNALDGGGAFGISYPITIP